jgi:hypothetical protein
MPWARIDDGFDDHPKVLALLEEEGAGAAVGLWTLCLTWAHRNTRKKGKTPGLLPVHLPRRYLGADARDAAHLLVKHRLWDSVDDGWLIHDFDDYLPTEETRAARAEAGRRGAQKRWGTRRDGKLPSVSHGSDGKPIASDSKGDGKTWLDDVADVSGGDDGHGSASVTAEPDISDANHGKVPSSCHGSDGKPIASHSSRAGLSPTEITPTPIPIPIPKFEEPKPSRSAPPPEVTTKQRSTAEATTAEATADRFDEFWAAYPRKVAKPAAARAWKKAIKNGADAATLINAATRYATTRAGENPKYTAHPATWLNNERWNDTPTTPPDNDEPAHPDLAADIAQLRTGPPCQHGDPGGNSPHPVHGTPLCAKCRRGIPAARDAPNPVDTYRRLYAAQHGQPPPQTLMTTVGQQRQDLRTHGISDSDITRIAANAAVTGNDLVQQLHAERDHGRSRAVV